ncbi:hypothetical protein CP981_06375 [Streptomyces platensis]|uniref:Uncharacterized protein n=1 Tax=Streptomyces platensis TaxID=58346 RepID=A0AAE6NEB7_STRPT|nr:hypothetical protein CP981_06375 [Streptomyces platensis]
MAPAGLRPDRPSMPAPRAYGDGPGLLQPVVVRPVYSPHPRGWSRAVATHPPRRHLLPAPAGLAP